MSQAYEARAYTWAELDKDQPMLLLERRRVIGQRVMLSRVALKKGCLVPTHQHDNEQFACILSGRLRFFLGAGGAATKEMVLQGGQVLHLSPNVPHGAEALEDTEVLDIFSPPSEQTGIDRES